MKNYPIAINVRAPASDYLAAMDIVSKVASDVKDYVDAYVGGGHTVKVDVQISGDGDSSAVLEVPITDERREKMIGALNRAWVLVWDHMHDDRPSEQEAGEASRAIAEAAEILGVSLDPREPDVENIRMKW